MLCRRLLGDSRLVRLLLKEPQLSRSGSMRSAAACTDWATSAPLNTPCGMVSGLGLKASPVARRKAEGWPSPAPLLAQAPARELLLEKLSVGCDWSGNAIRCLTAAASSPWSAGWPACWLWLALWLPAFPSGACSNGPSSGEGLADSALLPATGPACSPATIYITSSEASLALQMPMSCSKVEPAACRMQQGAAGP